MREANIAACRHVQSRVRAEALEFVQDDAAGELVLLKQYRYLFDPDLQPSDDLAVAFNTAAMLT